MTRNSRWQDRAAGHRDAARMTGASVAAWVEREARRAARAERVAAWRDVAEGAAGFVAGVALVGVALWALVA